MNGFLINIFITRMVFQLRLASNWFSASKYYFLIYQDFYIIIIVYTYVFKLNIIIINVNVKF